MEAKTSGPDKSYVTDRAIRSERRMLAMMRAGREKARPLSVMANPEAEKRLTGGQREAVRLILGSAADVVGVQGHAGTGKTAMLRTVASKLGHDGNVYRSIAEDRIMGLAPSSAAARVLSGRPGSRPGPCSGFSFATRTCPTPPPRPGAGAVQGQGARGGRVLHDRHGADGVPASHRPYPPGRPGRAGRGHPATARGGRGAAVPGIAEGRHGDGGDGPGPAPAGFRSSEGDRRAREGDPGRAIEGLGDRVFEAMPDRLGTTVAERWLALPGGDRAQTTLIAPTHLVRGDINRRVREGLLEEGVLHGKPLVIERLIDQRLTRAEASDPGSYREGDVVVFHRNAYGCTTNDVV